MDAEAANYNLRVINRTLRNPNTGLEPGVEGWGVLTEELFKPC